MPSAPPTIFSDARRIARRQRMFRSAEAGDLFLLDALAEDVIDRLGFIRLEPERALVIGDVGGTLTGHLVNSGANVARADIAGDRPYNLAAPYPAGGFNFIAVIGLLDAVNDLPGALIHLRAALAPGGTVIASFVGAGSLPMLRAIMQEADAERPAARIHPLVDVRAAAQLLQRAGWSDPVVDGHALRVRYSSLQRLVADLRAQGLGNALASPAPPLGKAGRARALAAFEARREEDGKVSETFEIVTLSGRRSLQGT